MELVTHDFLSRCLYSLTLSLTQSTHIHTYMHMFLVSISSSLRIRSASLSHTLSFPSSLTLCFFFPPPLSHFVYSFPLLSLTLFLLSPPSLSVARSHTCTAILGLLRFFPLPTASKNSIYTSCTADCLGAISFPWYNPHLIPSGSECRLHQKLQATLRLKEST